MIYVNRIIPVPDMSIRLSFQCTAWQFSSVSKHGRGTHTFAACLGSWANVALASNPLEIIRGLLILYPRRAPICTPHVRCDVISPNTKDGNLWIYAIAHMPELATNAVHPPRALVERYRFGIPMALLTSQLATGNCTKEKVGNFELG